MLSVKPGAAVQHTGNNESRLHQAAGQPARAHRVLPWTAQHVQSRDKQRYEQRGQDIGSHREEPDRRRHRHRGPCPRPPQHRPEQGRQQVPGRLYPAADEFHRRDGKQDQGHGEEGAQFHRLDVADARVEYEQGAARRNDHAGQCERQGRVSQRQIAHDLRDKARQNLYVPAVRAPVPGMLDSPDEELEVVVAKDGAPGWTPGNAQQHRYRGDADRRDLHHGTEHAGAPARACASGTLGNNAPSASRNPPAVGRGRGMTGSERCECPDAGIIAARPPHTPESDT